IAMLKEGKRPEAEKDGFFVPAQVDKGSIMTVTATDLPVTSRQLERIARRAGAGLARTGSFIGHGSGEIMLAFSTANVIGGEEPFVDVKSVREDLLDLAFRAVAEATNEAVLSSMLHAKTAYGLDGRVWYSLADFGLL
ncbi:MAG: P1 family peptidase, partial [Firmicutes bacterium]|nr:P1 family peptidase [Bacillota bacterium]